MPNETMRVHRRPLTQKDIDRENEKENRSYLNFVHRALLVSLHENMGFGGERMRTMAYNSYDVGEAALAENTYKPLLTSVEDLLAGAEPEYGEADFFETVDGTYWALSRELLTLGWNPEESLWPWKEPFTDADFPETWRKVTKSQREKRTAYLHYANKMSQICLTLLCMCAKELNQTNGFGALRLDRAMRPVGKRWLELMRVYLTMDAKAVWEMRKALRDEYNGMGVFVKEYAV